MKRRDLLRGAAVAPLLAGLQARGEQAAAKKPAEERLNKSKREISEAMSKVRLDNADGPDLMPRVRRRR